MDLAANFTLAETPREALRDIPWLRDVPGTTLDRLGERSLLHRVPSKSVLFEQAETPAFGLLLVEGSVELLAVRASEETLVELARAPDLLLPAAVLNSQPYLLRARVRDNARLIMIPVDVFRQAVTADHALCVAILACQAAQFRRQIRHAKNLLLRSAEERVGCYLLALVEQAPPGTLVRLPLEKRLIASQLGITRETFSRLLGVVASHGVRVERDIVLIEDPKAAAARFHLDPLIDGPETINPIATKRTRQ